VAPTTALIDADIVAFRCAASNNVEDGEEIAILRTDKLMRDIIDVTGTSKYYAFLTGSGNFRKTINPEYKANRKDKVLPLWLKSCKDYLTKEWGAITTVGYEADDALGFYSTDDTIICTIDKDLDQIQGHHYNFVKQEFYNVLELAGLQHFYKQMLIGDKADNIIGVAGIGKVKAGRLIDDLYLEEKMFDVVAGLYEGDEARFLMNAQCLWIWRKENDIWKIPDGLRFQ
jgi:DNA polymerase I